MLRLFAHHLRRQMQPGEVAARLGGDEFAIICRDTGSEEDLLERASAITGAIDRQLRKSAKARNCTASAGCAIAEPDDTGEDLSAEGRSCAVSGQGGLPRRRAPVHAFHSRRARAQGRRDRTGAQGPACRLDPAPITSRRFRSPMADWSASKR